MPPPHLEPYDEAAIAAPLQKLQRDIERSSNFRFACQFFQFSGMRGNSPADIGAAMETIIATPDCHRFLRDTFEPMYSNEFVIEPLHRHASIVITNGEFENILASAANDHLGAYSHTMRDSTAAEKLRIQRVFAALGDYVAFQLLPGSDRNCEECAHDYNNHLFSSWFYGVAWDWCFMVSWPRHQRLAVICITDTD